MERFTPFRMLWRKLKTMNVVGKYVLSSQERPIMSSDGTTLSDDITIQKVEEAIEFSQSDIEAVVYDQTEEDESFPTPIRPESSRREDFDFYF